MFLKSYFISFKGGIFSCDTDNCNNGLIPTNCTQSDYKPFGGNPFGNKTDIEANLYTTTTKNPMNVTSERPGGGNSIVMTKSLSGLILIINLMIAYFFYY